MNLLTFQNIDLLNYYIDNWLDHDTQANKRLLYTFIASLELGMSMNLNPLYLYNENEAYICSPVQVLNSSKRLEFELSLISSRASLIVPSYTRISRDIIARFKDVIRFDVPICYLEYINERIRSKL